MSERYYRCARAVCQRPSPLSRACARQLPQRGSPWHVGQLSSGRAKHNISETAVLRCLGQRQLDKERCPEAAVPASKARPFASCRASGVQWKVIRPAKASPFGRGGTEGDGEGKPGTKGPPRSDRQALCRSDTIAVQSCLAASLPSQSGLRPPAPPEGEPLAGRVTFLWTLKARRGAKGRALLTGTAASGQRTLSSCRWPRQRSTPVSGTLCFARLVEA